jgi:hypothetical protein
MFNNSRPNVVENNPDDLDFLDYWTLESLSDEFADCPEELVPGLISKDLTMFQGTAGSGKSLVAADLATAYTTGTKFLGKFDVNVNADRPNVCYINQDNFSHSTLRKRLVAFGCDPSKLLIPKCWFRLDDQSSIDSLVTFVKKHRVGLTVLDSIHAFHKLRDGKLEYLRDGFAALISAGTPVVLLSHITKSSTAADKGAAKGSGLLEATDYTFGMTAVAYGKFKVEPVKTRQGTEEPVSKFFVTYSGKSRLEQAPEITLEDKILQFIADAGETGTSSSAIRSGVGGARDLIDTALIELKTQYYCDGKRGPGKHIWDLKFKPESACDSSDAAESASNDYDEDLVAA